MKLFIELNMMQVLEDQTIYMTEVNKLIGCETEWAKKKREYREKMGGERTLSSHCPTDVPSLSDKSKSIEKEKELDKEIESERESEEDGDCDLADNRLQPFGKRGNLSVVYLSDNQVEDLLDKLGLEAFDRYVDRLGEYIIEKDAHIKNHYETILKWHKEDSRVRR
jgi:hypothetical protein